MPQPPFIPAYIIITASHTLQKAIPGMRVHEAENVAQKVVDAIAQMIIDANANVKT
jgi:hypothetical protein